MVELPNYPTGFGLLREKLLNSGRRQPIQDAKFSLAKALVHGLLGCRIETTAGADQIGGLARSEIRRCQDHLGPLVMRQVREPGSESVGLLDPPRAEGHVDVALFDRDSCKAGRVRCVAGDISGALPMSDDPQTGWPP